MPQRERRTVVGDVRQTRRVPADIGKDLLRYDNRICVEFLSGTNRVAQPRPERNSAETLASSSVRLSLGCVFAVLGKRLNHVVEGPQVYQAQPEKLQPLTQRNTVEG